MKIEASAYSKDGLVSKGLSVVDMGWRLATSFPIIVKSLWMDALGLLYRRKMANLSELFKAIYGSS